MRKPSQNSPRNVSVGSDTTADDDAVTEAGMESFPASDPPAYAMPEPEHQAAGKPHRSDRMLSLATMVTMVAVIILVVWGGYLILA